MDVELFADSDDDGYDVTDYYAADSRLGSLGDFAELLHQAANRGIKVIIDLVRSAIAWSTSPRSAATRVRCWPGSNG